MRIVLLIVILVVGVVVWYLEKHRRSVAKDLAELDEVVRGVVARISHGGEFLLREILKCDFVGIIDGREQRFVWIHLDEFDLWISKEKKRPHVWVKLKRREDIIEIVCRSTSRLGKAVKSLFFLISNCSNTLSEGFKRALREHVEILREIGASDNVIANAENTAERYGVSVPKSSK